MDWSWRRPQLASVEAASPMWDERAVRRFAAVLGSLAVVAVLSACSSSGSSSNVAGIPSTRPGPFASQADQVVTELAAGNFAAVEDKFDPALTAALPLSALRKARTAYPDLLGSYQSRVAPASVRVGQLDVERVPVIMAHGQGEVRISFRPDGSIAGLFFLKGGAPPP
jgi:hypothetical protein